MTLAFSSDDLPAPDCAYSSVMALETMSETSADYSASRP